MKKLLFLFAIFSFGFAFSQVSMSGNKLLKDGQTYKMSEYKEVFKNQEAANYFAKARTNKTVGEIFAYTGGFCLGFGLAQALKGEKTVTTQFGTSVVEKPKGAWTLVGIGAGLIGIGIPFAIGAKKNAQKAISIENGESTAFQPYFKLEPSGTGIALSYNF